KQSYSAIKNKPTPEGYKILTLCDSGYTYCFIFTSHIESVESNSKINLIPNVNKIGWQVYHLISQLPKVRINTSKFPTCLKIKKSQKLEWDILSGVVVDDVLVVFWMDNSPVTMLTTIHKILGEENRVERERRRPRTTSTNAMKVRSVFGNESKKVLPISAVIGTQVP
ncbi:18074_t:CDS:2, partial [Gigaspora rosea]